VVAVDTAPEVQTMEDDEKIEALIQFADSFVS
jgi:hypothetical protein